MLPEENAVRLLSETIQLLAFSASVVCAISITAASKSLSNSESGSDVKLTSTFSFFAETSRRDSVDSRPVADRISAEHVGRTLLNFGTDPLLDVFAVTDLAPSLLCLQFSPLVSCWRELSLLTDGAGACNYITQNRGSDIHCIVTNNIIKFITEHIVIAKVKLINKIK